MKTLSTTNSINRSPLRCGLFLIGLALALWAMPGTARGQVQGGDLFATVNLGGTLTNVPSPIYQYGSDYVPPGGTPGIFASALETPRGLAFDPVSGNLYVATNHNVDVSVDPAVVIGTIFKITPDGFMSTFATGFPVGFLQGLATDSAGNLFVTAQDDAVTNAASTIYKITPDGFMSTDPPFASLDFTGWALACDSTGNVYVATSDATNGNGVILRFAPDGTPDSSPFVGPADFPNTGPGPIGLAFDTSGNLFVSTVNGNDSTGDIRKFGPDGTEIIATGLTKNPRGLAFDSAGSLFLAELGTPPTDISPSITGDILEFTPPTPPSTTWSKSTFASQNFGTRWNRGPEWLAFTTGAVAPPSSAVTLAFPNGTSPLTTSVTPIDPGSVGTVPSGYQLTGSDLAFEIDANGTPTPPIIVAFTVPNLDATTFSQLRILHFVNGTPVDATASDPAPDPVTQTIYASVSSLSPFELAMVPGLPSLGRATPYTIFALNGPSSGGKQTATFSSGTDYGKVAVAAGAALQLQAPFTINGNLYVDSGGSVSGPGKVNGTRFTNQDLSGARDDALNASSQAASLAPNLTFSNITANKTVNGVAGLNVVNITGKINLNNASLTLNGPANAFFVVNVAGSITLGGSGGIFASGGMPASHLLINMTGSGSNLLSMQVGNVIQGTLLGPNVGGTLRGSVGAALLGQKFSLSNVTLTHP
jgi:hypothetical protein